MKKFASILLGITLFTNLHANSFSTLINSFTDNVGIEIGSGVAFSSIDKGSNKPGVIINSKFLNKNQFIIKKLHYGLFIDTTLFNLNSDTASLQYQIDFLPTINYEITDHFSVDYFVGYTIGQQNQINIKGINKGFGVNMHIWKGVVLSFQVKDSYSYFTKSHFSNTSNMVKTNLFLNYKFN